MSQADHSANLTEQREALALEVRCCTTLEKLRFDSLGQGERAVTFDQRNPVIKVSGLPVPAVALNLDQRPADALLEFASFTDRKRGMMKFSNVLFVRPSVQFLDAKHGLIALVEPEMVCLGEKSGGGTGWSRIPIPNNAALAVITPSLSVESQLVDTRRLGNVGMAPGTKAIVESIADARQTYISRINFGYSGLASVEYVAPDAAPLGRCASE